MITFKAALNISEGDSMNEVGIIGYLDEEKNESCIFISYNEWVLIPDKLKL